jgi:hypothetical protein
MQYSLILRNLKNETKLNIKNLGKDRLSGDPLHKYPSSWPEATRCHAKRSLFGDLCSTPLGAFLSFFTPEFCLRLPC